MNIYQHPYLKAEKPRPSCVRVAWKKRDYGACKVNHIIKFKNKNGTTMYTRAGTNIGEIMQCDIKPDVNITAVELTIIYRSETTSFYQKVLENNIPTGNVLFTMFVFLDIL